MITKSNCEKMYEAEVKGKDLLFDTQGKFLKEEKKHQAIKKIKINLQNLQTNKKISS